MKNLFYLCLLISWVICGCKKTSDDSGVTFINYADKKMNYKIYASQSDYFNDKNVILKGSVPANSRNTIAYNFTNNVNYYVDYYSDDYWYNNWLPYHGNLGDSYSYFRVDSSAKFIICGIQMSAMRVLLDDSLTQTKWKPINSFDLFDPATSTWSSLPDSIKFQEFTFKKDRSALYTREINGDTMTYSFYLNSLMNGYTFEVNLPGYYSADKGGNSMPTGNGNFPTKDTLLLMRSDLRYLIMVKQ